MNLNIKIAFDGACNNHLIKQGIDPPMGLGIAVFINNNYCEELSKFVHVPGKINNSSNVAEWMACVEAIKLAAELYDPVHNDTIEIQSDSQLITYQYNGDFDIKKGNFKEYYRQAKHYADIAGIRYQRIRWVKRELNKEADKLSKKGIAAITMSNDSKAISGNNKKVIERS